jgi:hypothetical protein
VDNWIAADAINAFLFTCLLARGKDPERWETPREDDQLQLLLDCLEHLGGIYFNHGVEGLMGTLKDLSTLARKCWVTGEELLIFSPLHKICRWDLPTFGYLGRSLPCKTGDYRLADIKNAKEKFLTFRDTSNKLVPQVQSTLNKWSEKSRLNLNLESIPYSESASLFTPREIGGQARFYRDILHLVEQINRKHGPIYTSLIPGNTDPEKILNMRTMDTSITARSNTTHNIMSLIDWLDEPFLNHVEKCSGECREPEKHFPYRIEGIPETGWRTRCASLPWPTICFATEIPRRCIMRNQKKDEIAATALDDFERLPEVTEYDFINSTDLLTATDNLPLNVQDACGSTIGKHWRETLYYRYIRASFKSSRIVEGKFEAWPGLDYFLDKVNRIHRLSDYSELPKNVVTDLIHAGFYAKFRIDPHAIVTPDTVVEAALGEKRVSKETYTFKRIGFHKAGEGPKKPSAPPMSSVKKIDPLRYYSQLTWAESYQILAYLRDWYRNNFMSRRNSGR